MPSSPWPSSPDGLGLLNPEEESPLVLRNAGNTFIHTTSLPKDFSLRRHYRGNVKSRRRGITLFCGGFRNKLLSNTVWTALNNPRRGPGSSVGIATGYRLNGPGIKSSWGRDFPHRSRPALGPTHPPVQWVPGLSRNRKRPGRDADPSPPSSAEV
jgi:hypothetical protein